MIAISVGDRLIAQSELLLATFRTDLIPVPVTLEFTVQHSAELESLLQIEAELSVGDGLIPMTLIKVQPMRTQTVKDGKRIGAIACFAVFRGLELLIKSSHKAIIQKQASFNQALRACGAKVSLSADLPLPEFVCLKGRVPTQRLALYLQQEAAVIHFDRGKIACSKIDNLLQREPIAKYDTSAIAWVENPVIKDNLVPSYVSVDEGGSGVVGEDTRAGRPVGYKARLDSRQLKNLEKVLIHHGTILRPYDQKLEAGQTIMSAGDKLLILTAVHHFESGALGGTPVMATKAWLSALVER